MPKLFPCVNKLCCISIRLFLLVKVEFAVAIFITYGLQFYVPIQILWPLAQRRLPANSWSSRHGELILRFIFVLATCKERQLLSQCNIYMLPMSSIQPTMPNETLLEYTFCCFMDLKLPMSALMQFDWVQQF